MSSPILAEVTAVKSAEPAEKCPSSDIEQQTIEQTNSSNDRKTADDSNVSPGKTEEEDKTATEVISDGQDAPKKPKFYYTKEELIELSKLPYSRSRPEFLNKAYNNTVKGLWNPEKWGETRTELNVDQKVENERSKLDTFERGSSWKRDRLERSSESNDKEVVIRRKSGDPRDRLKEESQDEIVLSPQRRSFGTGCHVTRNEVRPLAREPVLHESRETDKSSAALSNRNRNGVRIGSGRIIPARETRTNSREEWSSRTSGSFERERSFESRSFREEESRKPTTTRFNRFADYDGKRVSGNNTVRNKYQIQRDYRANANDEPEWFTGGPTSQHETIELKGFEEHEEQEKETNKQSSTNADQKSFSDSRSQSRASSQEETIATDDRCSKSRRSNPSANASERCTPVERLFNSVTNANTKELGSQEFDINEIFKMDTWRVPPFVAESTVSSTGAPEALSNTGTEGTSRFAQWFSESKPDSSPIDRLFGQAVSNQNENRRENLSQAGKRDITSNGEGEKQGEMKDIMNLFQKANISISHIMHSEGPQMSMDMQKAPLVSDIEASLANESRQNQIKEIKSNPVAPHHVMDLLKEEDLFAMNQQFKSFENQALGPSAPPPQQPLTGPQNAHMRPPFLTSSAQGNNGGSSMSRFFPESARLMMSEVAMAQEIPIKVVRQNEMERVQEAYGPQGGGGQVNRSNSATSNMFMPTSVIRKIASEKDRDVVNRTIANEDKLLTSTSQNSTFFSNGVSNSDGHNVLMGSCSMPRPIVKSGNIQGSVSPQPPSMHSSFAPMPPPSMYAHPDYESLNKMMEQQRLHQAAALMNQQRYSSNVAGMPTPSMVVAGARNPQPSVGPMRPQSSRPSAPQSAGVKSLPTTIPLTSQGINMPIIRNMVQSAQLNPNVRSSMNPLQFPLLPRGAPQLDPRHLQALAQARGLHPMALQQLVIKAAAANIQTQAAAAAAAAAAVSAAQAQVQAQAGSPFSQLNALRASQVSPNRLRGQDNGSQQKLGKITGDDYQAMHHNVCSSFNGVQHNNAQSPENLTRWFGNEMLQQELPEMPPVPLQKALLLEDIERQ